jgi:hypothetical protein
MKFFALAAMLNLLASCNENAVMMGEGENITNSDRASVLYCPNDLATLLNNSSVFTGAILPVDFDARSIEFKNKDISYVDFTNVKNLTVKQLNKARALRGVKLPAGFVMTGFDSSNKDLGDTDFSGTFGLTAKMLNDSMGYAGAILPVGMDLTDLDPTGRSINRLDFSQTVGLDPMKVLNSSDALAIAYPATFFDSVDPLAFSDIETNRAADVAAAVVYPTSFGILDVQDAENFYHGGSWISYRTLQILDPNDPDPLDGIDVFLPVNFSDVDLSSVDTTEVSSVIDLDLTDIQNVDYTLFNNVAFVDEVIVPNSLEIDKIDPLFKATGWDYTNIQSKYYACK